MTECIALSSDEYPSFPRSAFYGPPAWLYALPSQFIAAYGPSDAHANATSATATCSLCEPDDAANACCPDAPDDEGPRNPNCRSSQRIENRNLSPVPNDPFTPLFAFILFFVFMSASFRLSTTPISHSAPFPSHFHSFRFL